MELHRYLGILRRRLVYVLAAVLLCGAAAWAATPKQAQYSAESVIYVGARQYTVTPGAQYSIDPSLLAKSLLATYSKMLDSTPIASDALQLARVPLSADEVVAHTTITNDKDTQLLRVHVTDNVPEQARRLADSIAKAFVDKIATLDPNTAPTQTGQVPGLPASVFEQAKLPTTPDPSGLARNVVLAALFGLLVSVGVVFLLEYLDLTVKTPAEAERRLGLPVLAVIPFRRDRSDMRLAPATPPAADSAPGTGAAGGSGATVGSSV